MNGNVSLTALPLKIATNFSSNHKGTDGLDQNISVAVLMGLVAALLAFQNYLLIFAVSVKRLRRVPEVLIFWLALSSLMNTITLAISAYHRAYDNEGRKGITALCKAQFWFATTLRTNDICTTTLMSIDRFIAITRPFVYRAKVRVEFGWISVISSFVLSGLISCLPFIGFGSISRIIPSICVAKWDSDVSILIVIFAYIQFFVVLLCYIGVFWSIKNLVKRQKAMAKSQEITYDSPSLRHKNFRGLSANPSLETSTTSLEVYPQNTGDRPVSLRIKAALNRSLSNCEGARSASLTISKPDLRSVNSLPGSVASLRSEAASTSRSGSIRLSQSRAELNEPRSDSSLSLKRGSVPRDVTTPDGASGSSERSDLKPSVYRHLNSIRERIQGSFMRRKRQNGVKKQWKESEHFAKVMGVIVLLFYISWLPLAVCTVKYKN